MNRLTLVEFFESILQSNEDSLGKIEKEFDYFIDMIFEVNNSEDDFIRKFRILNYTKIRLEVLSRGIKTSGKAKKKYRPLSKIHLTGYSLN